MAKNRKNQSAAIRFGPALKALFLCLLIAGSAVGYVWQKSQIYQLGKQIRLKEARLTQLARDNKKLDDQLGLLRSPVILDQRVRELKLGLGPVLPMNVFRLPDSPVSAPESKNSPRLLAVRLADATTQ